MNIFRRNSKHRDAVGRRPINIDPRNRNPIKIIADKVEANTQRHLVNRFRTRPTPNPTLKETFRSVGADSDFLEGINHRF